MTNETPKPWPCWTHKEPTKDCESCYQAFVKLFGAVLDEAITHAVDEKPDNEVRARIDGIIGRIDTSLKFPARPWPIGVLEDARLELQRFRALLNNQPM